MAESGVREAVARAWMVWMTALGSVRICAPGLGLTVMSEVWPVEPGGSENDRGDVIILSAAFGLVVTRRVRNLP